MDLLSFLYEARQAKMPAEVQVNFADVDFFNCPCRRSPADQGVVVCSSERDSVIRMSRSDD